MSRALCIALSLAVACSLSVPPNVDRDNDLVSDRDDNCPDLANPDQSNFDGDDLGDVCDVCDDTGGADTDQDGIPDTCDGCIGIGVDVDMDGIDDACDDDTCISTGSDSDHDGIDDGCDPQICVEMNKDDDHDGVDDGCDPCRKGPQHDEDGDGEYDACDNCPADANPDQADTIEATAVRDAGDVCDQDPAVNTFVFDPFTTADGSQYVQGIGVAIGPEQLSLTGVAPAWVMVGGGELSPPFAIRTRVSVLGSGLASDVGVLVADAPTQPAGNSITCHVRQSAGALSAMLYLDFVFDGTAASSGAVMTTSDPSYDFALSIESDGTVYCTANGAKIKVNTATPSKVVYGGVFSAHQNSYFDWYFALH